MPKPQSQSGFTILELLMVIVIIGILALIVMPGLVNGPKRARDTQRKSDIRAIKGAIETYFNDNGAYPAAATYVALGPYLVTGYMPSLPTDPKAGNPTYSYVPSPVGCSTCTGYTLDAFLENGSDSQIKPGTANTYQASNSY